jgi:hypothetical protein
VAVDAQGSQQVCVQAGEAGVVRSAVGPGDYFPFQRDLAVVQHDDAVGQRNSLIHIVGDQQHGRLVGGYEVSEQAVHLEAGQRIQGAERFVRQQQFGIADQGSGQRNTLLLTAGKLMRPGPFASGESHFGERTAAAISAS